MQFEQDCIKLKPSEAAWIANEMAKTDHIELARKAVRARRAAVAPYLSRWALDCLPELSRDLNFDPDDVRGGLRRLRARLDLQETEKKYAFSADGEEQHTITMTMTEEEIAELHDRVAKLHITHDAVEYGGQEAREIQAFLDKDNLDHLSADEQADFQRRSASSDLREAVTFGILLAIEARDNQH